MDLSNNVFDISRYTSMDLIDKNPGYMALKYHAEEAFAEAGIRVECVPFPSYALFAKAYYRELRELDKTKVHDYCFMGSINSAPEKRQWVIDFARTHFTEASVFLNTDNPPDWEPLGPFDVTGKVDGFAPKNTINPQSSINQYRVVRENLFYFETLSRSKFSLCPAGDNKWSWRFYETLMCESIPIVETRHHTYRTKSEGHVNYKYYLAKKPETHLFDPILIDHNLYVFECIHLLPKLFIES